MIRIIFKNVGQGDSVILEWENGNEKKTGIIDCNEYLGTNPVLDHVKAKNIQEISFLLLTHPHLDHCSGFTSLMRFCIDNSIKINHFLHTSNDVPDFWKAAVEGKFAETEILKLYHIIREAREKTGMPNHPIQADLIYNDFTFGSEYSIKIIAPNNKHLDNFVKPISFNPLDFEEESGNNPKANWLATVIKIHSNKHDGYILLTSDANKEAMFYDKTYPKEFEGRLILAQCPHHGADKNYKNSFWNIIKRIDNTPIVISVGKNGHGHPSRNVISDLDKNNYDIYSTNRIGSLLGVPETLEAKEAVSHLLVFGNYVPATKKDKFNGDKIFEINTFGKVAILS